MNHDDVLIGMKGEDIGIGCKIFLKWTLRMILHYGCLLCSIRMNTNSITIQFLTLNIFYMYIMLLYVLQSHSYDEANKTPKNVFDLESFVGDLTVEEDACR